MRLRFACGALLGLVVALGMCFGLWLLSTLGVCMVLAIAVVACGLGAAYLG